MPLLCYVHRRDGGAPYFEVLPDLDPIEAAKRALALMADRPDAIRAELWEGERLLQVLERQSAG